MKFFAVASASSLVALLIAACSGASPTELFAAGDTSKATPSDGASPSTRPGRPGSPGDDEPGDPQTPRVPENPGTAPPDAGPISSDAGPNDASTDASPTDASSDGATRLPLAGNIPCGSRATQCAVSSEACCAKQGPPAEYECKALGNGSNACGGALPVRCNDRSDCPANQVCCGMLDQDDGYTSVQCRLTCLGGNNVTAVRFCDLTALNDECLAIGQQCMPSQRLPGFGVCQP